MDDRQLDRRVIYVELHDDKVILVCRASQHVDEAHAAPVGRVAPMRARHLRCAAVVIATVPVSLPAIHTTGLLGLDNLIQQSK